VLLPEIEEGFEGTSFTVTLNVLGVPLPQELEGVQDKTPDALHVTETAFPVPVIVAADDGFTLQL
jgi:hypothetical protein